MPVLTRNNGNLTLLRNIRPIVQFRNPAVEPKKEANRKRQTHTKHSQQSPSFPKHNPNETKLKPIHTTAHRRKARPGTPNRKHLGIRHRNASTSRALTVRGGIEGALGNLQGAEAGGTHHFLGTVIARHFVGLKTAARARSATLPSKTRQGRADLFVRSAVTRRAAHAAVVSNRKTCTQKTQRGHNWS